MNKQKEADELGLLITRYFGDGDQVGDGYNYAPVTEDDVELLYEIFEKLRNIKFKSDIDGDYPIRFSILNLHNEQEIVPAYMNKIMKDDTTLEKLITVNSASSMVSHQNKIIVHELHG